MKKRISKQQKDKPLTLNVLANYTQEVFIPALEARFVRKKEFTKFRDESLKNQDAMLKKLDILLTEKEVREHQERKEKELWAIVIKALREHDILSTREIEQIARLDIF